VSRRVKVLLGGLGAFALLFATIQLVPYRVTNPAVQQEPAWNSTRTRQLAVVACYDCHSNETSTYWWEDVAPLSWWITNHVEDGRRALNFSECRRGGGENDAVESVQRGSMPPSYYTWFGLHGDAKLTAAQRQELAGGLRTTLAGWNCGDGG
jgi:mono/diheme cytochrome c family protein